MSPQRSSCRSSRIFPPGSTSILPSRSRFRRRRSWLNRSQGAHRRSSGASGSPATRLRSRARLATPSSAARPSIGQVHLLARSMGCERAASTPSSSKCWEWQGSERRIKRLDSTLALSNTSVSRGAFETSFRGVLPVARRRGPRSSSSPGLSSGGSRRPESRADRHGAWAARSGPGLRPRMEVERPAVPARLRPVVGVLLRIAD